jgi:hypothetical protein
MKRDVRVRSASPIHLTVGDLRAVDGGVTPSRPGSPPPERPVSPPPEGYYAPQAPAPAAPPAGRGVFEQPAAAPPGGNGSGGQQGIPGFTPTPGSSKSDMMKQGLILGTGFALTGLLVNETFA